jgi:hypothetical protein
LLFLGSEPRADDFGLEALPTNAIPAIPAVMPPVYKCKLGRTVHASRGLIVWDPHRSEAAAVQIGLGHSLYFLDLFERFQDQTLVVRLREIDAETFSLLANIHGILKRRTVLNGKEVVFAAGIHFVDFVAALMYRRLSDNKHVTEYDDETIVNRLAGEFLNRAGEIESSRFTEYIKIDNFTIQITFKNKFIKILDLLIHPCHRLTEILQNLFDLNMFRSVGL